MYIFNDRILRRMDGIVDWWGQRREGGYSWMVLVFNSFQMAGAALTLLNGYAMEGSDRRLLARRFGRMSGGALFIQQRAATFMHTHLHTIYIYICIYIRWCSLSKTTLILQFWGKWSGGALLVHFM